MNTITKEAGDKAGQAFDIVANDSSLTDEQRTLLAKLRSLAEMLEQYRATVAMIELDRLRLQSQLRATGWRPPSPQGGDA